MSAVQGIDLLGLHLPCAGQQQQIVDRSATRARRPSRLHPLHIFDGRDADERQPVVNIPANQTRGIRRRQVQPQASARQGGINVLRAKLDRDDDGTRFFSGNELRIIRLLTFVP